MTLSSTIVTGVAGNFIMSLFLGLHEDGFQHRFTRTDPPVAVGVVARSALEILVIFGINFNALIERRFEVQDGIGIGLLLVVDALLL